MSSHSRYKRIFLNFTLVILVVFIAAVLRIWPLHGLELRVPWVTFYPGVMLLALWGGLSSGALALLLSVGIVLFWSPTGQPFINDPGDWLGLTVFFINCSFVIAICEAIRRASTRDLKTGTENGEALETLTMSESLLNETGRMAKIGGWELDTKSLTLKWTEETYRIHEVPINVIPQLEKAINFYHPDDRHKLESVVQNAIKQGTPFDVEVRFISEKGKHLWVRSIGKPLLVDGEVVKLYGTIQDVTKIKTDKEKLEATNQALSESNARLTAVEQELQQTNAALSQHKEHLEELIEERTHKLQQSEIRLKALFDNMPSGFAECELLYDEQGKPEDFRILSINPVFEKLAELGEDAIGKGVRKLIPTLPDSLVETFEQVATTGVPRIFDYYSARLKRHFKIYAFSARKGYFATLLNDITKAKQQAADLEKVNTLANQALELSDSSYWSVDFSEPEYVYCNDRLVELLGLTKNEANKYHLVDDWYKGMVAADPQLAEENFKKFTNSVENKNARYDTGFAFKRFDNGKIEWANVLGDIIRDKDGTPLEMNGVLQIITQRKNAESELVLSNKRLEALVRISEYEIEDVEMFLDYALDEAIELTQSKIGYIYYYDEEKGEFTLNSWSKGVMTECSVVKPNTKYQLAKTGLWGEVVRQRKAIMVNDYSPSHPLARGAPKGHVKMKRYLSVPVFVEHKIVAVVGVANKESDYSDVDSRQLDLMMGSVWRMVDICKHKKNLIEAKEQAVAANKAKSIFLANMSHEIRTPMNAILGFSQILKNREEDTQNQYYAESIYKSGSALLALINDILDISRIESGKMELQNTEVSLPHLCRELEAFFVQKAKEHGLSLEFVIDEKISQFLMLDEARLRQILINLLGNAMKFTHHGFVRLTVSCEFQKKSKQNLVNMRFVVSDTGVGIPERQIDNIFGSFEQVKGQKETQYGGTGLGLAITKRIVELMGGAISVESEEGVGSIFTVVIPDVEVSGGSYQPSQDDVIDLSAITFAPATILVVDDIDYNLEILSSYLSKWHFTLHHASDGKEALEKAHEISPDIILLDMKMPVMDGYKASAKLKESAKTRNIPIISITASALKQDEEKIRKTCDGYVRKPVTKNALIKELKKFLPHEVKKTPTAAIEHPLPGEVCHESLRDIPKELISDMRHAIEKGDMDRLMKLIDQLAEQDEIIAGKMRKLAEGYEYDILLGLL